MPEVLKCATQVGEALEYAHEHGIVHRDLKPQNIMLTKSGVKLLDFGLAQLRYPDTAHLQVSDVKSIFSSRLVGTLTYMAPERIVHQESDARSDIFGFGALVYQMVTGRSAFGGPNPAAVISSILNHNPPAMSEMVPLSAPEGTNRRQESSMRTFPEKWNLNY